MVELWHGVVARTCRWGRTGAWTLRCRFYATARSRGSSPQLFRP